MATDDIAPVKACTKCGGTFPATTEHFAPAKAGKFGVHSNCRACMRARTAAYRQGVVLRAKPAPESASAGFKTCTRCRSVLPANTEHFHHSACGTGGLNSQCRHCKNEKIAAFKRANPERASAWYWNNRERELEKRRAIWRDPERAKKAAHSIEAWRTANPERHNAIRRNVNSRRRLREALGGSFGHKDIAGLKAMQRSKCWWCQCKITDYHIDHRIPLARGGTNMPSNLVLSCAKCNQRKSAKMPWELESPRLL